MQAKWLMCLSVAFLAVAIFIISCGGDGTSSGKIEFVPGVYGGTYQVNVYSGSGYIDKMDTVIFTFTKGGQFLMRRDTIFINNDTLHDTLLDRDQRFCEVTGKYQYNNSMFDIDTTSIYPQSCVPGEEPDDIYDYFCTNSTIVLEGRDDVYQRKIILNIDWYFEPFE